ncbi:unnamed protein product [Tilletia controversa]|uniref:HMG box domain-containing protein n=1 Tax=Tilletia caries TaxID=13290 RepID=A0ABN7IQ49_9BASI|nr:unnamed protein product [Tilletia controversa]CAD6907101.1 unnamed protein product [Tilletia caries]CAD6912979.1 unnamed protein product [Tilletia controversa]CAD6932925.1 unnamed protein product [Tilletia controversa]CAD6970365.1 unnamed protein product [Tilletia controversa]
MSSTHPPPRPPNSWILYRAAKSRELAKGSSRSSLTLSPSTGSGSPQRPGKGGLTRMLARMWKEEPLSVRRWFEDLAEQKKLEHTERYPGYKYKPRRKEIRREPDSTGLDPSVHGHISAEAEVVERGITSAEGGQYAPERLSTTEAGPFHTQQDSHFAYQHINGAAAAISSGSFTTPVSLHTSAPHANLAVADSRAYSEHPAVHHQAPSEGIVYSNVSEHTGLYQRFCHVSTIFAHD